MIYTVIYMDYKNDLKSEVTDWTPRCYRSLGVRPTRIRNGIGTCAGEPSRLYQRFIRSDSSEG